ncbi:MAG: hypothetical protein A3K60_01130 [Euryarchaeota archaeon RBG_19FT_COMBO_56_21]|nr:MAG: hypothetical protein A3K60_01130 [Euryarchaeota archaeon RBG_19FT_COMBO_56_21]
MTNRGTRGAYRKEDRVSLPPELQKELVEKAAAKYGNCQELAKHLNIPKSSVHYYRIGRLTIPVSLLERMLEIAGDIDLEKCIKEKAVEKDRTWANEYAISIYREICREKLRLPTREDLESNDELRRKAATIVSYVLAEGSVWLQKAKWGECAVNITFADHETDLYEHFRALCFDVFLYEIGPPQKPGNGTAAIRGFIYSRFIAEWLIEHGVHPGDKAARELHLPAWIMKSGDPLTWSAALQPWCDGEGHVEGSSQGRPMRFTMLQARHTDLDCESVPRHLICGDSRRSISAGYLKDHQVHGVPILGYCWAFSRSEVLGDVADLFKKLGFHPRVRVASLFLKNNGFWSCQWSLAIPSYETRHMTQLGIITQQRKKGAILSTL